MEASKPIRRSAPPILHAGRRLYVLARRALEESVRGAVERGLRILPRLKRAQVLVLEERVLREFLTLARQKGFHTRGVTKRAFLRELARRRRELLAERDRATDELAEARTRARARAADRRALAERLAADEGARVDALLRELFAQAEHSRTDLRVVRREVVEALGPRLSALAEAALARAAEDPADELDRLERRVAKLSSSLSELEGAMRRLAAAKSLDEGLASIFRTVQGLAPDDGHFAQKREMLREIWVANLELQRRDTPLRPAA
jgi:hypothetical protein